MKRPSVVLIVIEDPATGKIRWADTAIHVPAEHYFREPEDCPAIPSGFRKRVKIVREIEVE